MREVEDRARAEENAAVKQLKTASRNHDDLQRKLELAQSELSRGQRHAAVQATRAETLE